MTWRGGPYDKRRTKTFEKADLVHGIFCTWYASMGFRDHQHAQRVIGKSRFALYHWRNGDNRPDTTALRRMLRLLLWSAEGWPPSLFERIDWDGHAVEFVDGAPAGTPNPFVMLPATAQRQAHTFPYGSPRDNSACLRNVRDLFNLDRLSRSRMLRILGMPWYYTGAHDHFRRWLHGQSAIGPMYLTRLLALTLWGLDSVFGVALTDLWAVDWKARTVSYDKSILQERQARDPYYVPPNPFERLLVNGRNGYGRPVPGNRKAKTSARVKHDSWAAPTPIRAYDPWAGIPSEVQVTHGMGYHAVGAVNYIGKVSKELRTRRTSEAYDTRTLAAGHTLLGNRAAGRAGDHTG